MGCASSSSRPAYLSLSPVESTIASLPRTGREGRGGQKPQERERQEAARPRRFPVRFRLAALLGGLVVGEDRVIIGFVIFIRAVAMGPRRTAKGEIISESSGGCHAI